MATSQWRRMCGLGCVLWLLCASVWAQAGDKPPFYHVRWQGQQAYLLGSIHLGRADFYPLPRQIEAALTQAKGLVVEVDMTKADTQGLLQRYGMADATKGLHWQSRSGETHRLMSAFCASREDFCNSIQSFAPWLQASQLNVLRYQELGYSITFGVEMQLLKAHNSLPVFELETAAFQFALLASLDSQLQWSMVRDAISVSDAELLALISAWRRGDEAALDNLMQEQLAAGGNGHLIDKLLWQRNQTMAKGIMQLLSADGPPKPLFIVVGAGHVVGDNSVVQLLRQAGAKVTACWAEPCV
ncbi:MAG: TraB/GumN family protein [Shewanella sp.]